MLLLVSAVSVVGLDIADADFGYSFDNDTVSLPTINDITPNNLDLIQISGSVQCGLKGQINDACDPSLALLKTSADWNINKYCFGIGVRGTSFSTRLFFAEGGYADVSNSGTSLQARHYTGGAWSDYSTCNIDIPTSRYSYYVISYDGTTLKQYVNKTECASVVVGNIDQAVDLIISNSDWTQVIDEAIFFNTNCSIQNVNDLTDNFFGGLQYPFTAPNVSLDILFLNSSGFVDSVFVDNPFYVVLNLTSDGVAVNDSSCNVSFPILGLKETSFNFSDDFYYSGVLTYNISGNYSINVSCSLPYNESRVLMVLEGIDEPVPPVESVGVDLSPLSDALINIFLLMFWVVLLVLALTLKGVKGGTIQFFNIMQMVVGFVAGSVWMHDYFLIGFPLIFVSLGFFLGLIMDK